MKKLIYVFRGNRVEMTWSEKNEAIAKLEADGGLYTVTEDEQEEKESDED